uniref:Secreted protein n=1 Tax=Parastrongyloides trichosuri TaxID=131310 RepID=A0A0N5A167_PARTI
MKFSNIVFLGLIATTGAKYLNKRGSGYGDELVTPGYVVQSTQQSYEAPTNAPIEQNYVESKQEYAPVEPKIEQSGYRKRSAGYGDELVTPSPVTAAPYGMPEGPYPTSAPEYMPVTERNEYNAGYAPAAQPSGY